MIKTNQIIVLFLGLSLIILSCSKTKSRSTDRALQIVGKSYYVYGYQLNPLYKDDADNINAFISICFNK